MQLPQIPKTIEDFSFTLDGNLFGKSLKLCDEVIKFSEADKMIEDLNMVVCTGSKVYLIGRTIDTFIINELSASGIEGVGAALLDFSQLSPVVRKDLIKFEFTRGEMLAKSRNSKLKISVRHVSQDQLMSLDMTIRNIEVKNNADILPPNVVSELKRAVDMSYIPDLYTDASVNSHITLKSGQLTVVTSSNFISALYEAEFKERVPDTKISLGSDMLKLLYKVVGDADTQFYVNGANFVASADNFLVLLPPVRSSKEDFQKFDIALDTLGSATATGNGHHDMVLAVNTLAALVSANKALKGQSVKFNFSAKSGQALLKFSTDGQSLVEKIKFATKDTFTFNADIRLFQLLLKALGNGIKGGECDHLMRVFGPVGKYKAFMLDYDMKEFRIKYLMHCTN
jgi:hypothetical protein